MCSTMCSPDKPHALRASADTFPAGQAESQLSQGMRMTRFGGTDKKKGEEGPLIKICRDTGKLSAEQVGPVEAGLECAHSR